MLWMIIIVIYDGTPFTSPSKRLPAKGNDTTAGFHHPEGLKKHEVHASRMMKPDEPPGFQKHACATRRKQWLDMVGWTIILSAGP